MKKKRLILVGESASGKDYARKISEEWLGLKYGVSYTTRPPRADEIDGQDYFFLQKEEFEKMVEEDKWYEYVMFNGWYYGTTRDQMKESGYVFIMTPKGLSHLTPQDRKESFVIYFNIDEDIRRIRMSRRAGNADTVERRIKADRLDFTDYDNYDTVITNPYFKIGHLFELVYQQMKINYLEIAKE
jgi:guanylate kinase